MLIKRYVITRISNLRIYFETNERVSLNDIVYTTVGNNELKFLVYRILSSNRDCLEVAAISLDDVCIYNLDLRSLIGSELNLLLS